MTQKNDDDPFGGSNGGSVLRSFKISTLITISILLSISYCSFRACKGIERTSNERRQKETEREEQIAELKRNQAEYAAKVQQSISNLDLKGGWKLEGFGNVLVYSGCATNKGSREVIDLLLTCNLYSQSNTQVGSVSQKILMKFPVGKKVCFKDFNLGFVHNQTESASCRITDLDII